MIKYRIFLLCFFLFFGCTSNHSMDDILKLKVNSSPEDAVLIQDINDDGMLFYFLEPDCIECRLESHVKFIERQDDIANYNVKGPNVVVVVRGKKDLEKMECGDKEIYYALAEANQSLIDLFEVDTYPKCMLYKNGKVEDLGSEISKVSFRNL